MSDRTSVTLFFIALIALLAGVIWAGNMQDAACHKAGGHIISLGRDVVCVTKDGRILDI